jgi:hypothetical protein
MNKKLLLFGGVFVAIGVGYYFWVKSKQPTRAMFDEMVGNCTPPCDVFSGLTQSQLNQLFDAYKKLTKEDAQFMIDFMAKKDESSFELRRFNTLFEQMAKAVKK